MLAMTFLMTILHTHLWKASTLGTHTATGKSPPRLPLVGRLRAVGWCCQCFAGSFDSAIQEWQHMCLVWHAASLLYMRIGCTIAPVAATLPASVDVILRVVAAMFDISRPPSVS